MQTFMPSGNYQEVAKQLDNKRLGKQRVEAYQILRALTGESTGWVNHPATKMWEGNIYQLACYGYAVCDEWRSRGFDDSLLEKFQTVMQNEEKTITPWWVNNRLLQITHQSNLLRKDWSHYSKYFRVPDNLFYVWPMPDEQAFRCGTITDTSDERTIQTVLKNGVVYLTSTQVAELLGVSPKTIAAYKTRGQMPAPDRQYGRTPLWKHSTIEAWRGTLKNQ